MSKEEQNQAFLISEIIFLFIEVSNRQQFWLMKTEKKS